MGNCANANPSVCVLENFLPLAPLFPNSPTKIKGRAFVFQKLKSLAYASHTTLSLYTLAYTLLRMSLRSHYSLSVLSLLLALHLCESSLGRWL